MIACEKEPVMFGKVPCLTAGSEVTVGLEERPEKVSEADGKKVGSSWVAVDKGLRTEAEKQTGRSVKVDAAMKLNVGPRRTGDGLGAEPCRIEDKDFAAEFDGKKWVVEWLWKEELPVLKNRVGCYEHALKGRVRDEFERELDIWLDEGILVPWEEGVEEEVLPPMAVFQRIRYGQYWTFESLILFVFYSDSIRDKKG